MLKEPNSKLGNTRDHLSNYTDRPGLFKTKNNLLQDKTKLAEFSTSIDLYKRLIISHLIIELPFKFFVLCSVLAL